MKIDPRLRRVAAAQKHPLLFASISGAHLYGFPSADSDYDLRGAHILPLREIAGLRATEETIEDSRVVDGLEMDIVTHDIRKFFGLLLGRNGYVLEQLYSPLVVATSPAHEELKAVARGCVTREHAHHYLGFSENQWRLLLKETPRRVKPLLYVYRVLLTGIFLMRTGRVEADLRVLNETFRLPQLPDLIARKQTGAEQSVLAEADVSFHETEYNRLRAELSAASETSRLPDAPDERTKSALNDLLVRVRLGDFPP